MLERFSGEKDGILYETCFLTTKLIEWKKATDNGKTEGLDLTKLKCVTNDPAPPFNYKREPKYKDISFLQNMILDNTNYDLFDRYRALFTLRELMSVESVVAMCQCLTVENSRVCSPLLKHEVAFVLAQMEEVFHAAVPFLLDCVANDEEEPIVRHEVLICLGEMLSFYEKHKIEQFL